MTQPALDLLAAGCIFPSGPDLDLADIAMATQLALVRKHPFHVDRCGHPVRVSAFPGLPIDLERWWDLAQAALADLQSRLGEEESGRPGETGLWLILPDADRPGQPADLADALGERLEQALPSLASFRCLRGGHATGARALAQAGRWLDNKPQARAIVLAVECHLASDTLAWLEAQDLLHGAHRPYEGRARANPYGRVPGEGAAALALTAAQPQGARPPWARLLAYATAEETRLRGDERPCTGLGLTQAGRLALEQAHRHLDRGGLRLKRRQPQAFVGRVTADLNGEPYRADEFGFAWLRLAPWLADDCQRYTPALASGDLGCASAVAHLALAAHALRERPGNAAHLVLSSSDDTLRGACVLAPVSPEMS